MSKNSILIIRDQIYGTNINVNDPFRFLYSTGLSDKVDSSVLNYTSTLIWQKISLKVLDVKLDIKNNVIRD